MAGLGKGNQIDAASAEAAAAKLESFSRQLEPKERAILAALIEAALPPLEQMRHRPPEEVLTPEELRLLNEVRAESATK